MPGHAPATTGWRVLLLAAAAGICWFAFTPNPPPASVALWDKSQHLFAFAVLAALARLAYPRAGLAPQLGALLAFGVFIELVQSQIPERSAEIADLAADLGGALLVLPLRRWLTS
jgi:VanZ family protein